MVLSTFMSAQGPQTFVSTEKERTGVALTVYNSDRALVMETRNLTFPAGLFVSISATCLPRSFPKP